MENVVLRLIELLGALLDFPNMWFDDRKDIEPFHNEALQLLKTKLPIMLEYCKSDYQRGNKIPPELDDLRAILGRVIYKGRYTINAFIDTLRELEEDIQTRPYLWQIADEGKSWLYWLNRYYPQEQPAPASQEPNPTAIELPSELDSDEARGYFEKAIRLGLMSEQFKWLASQSLLACFCREMSVNLDLGKGYSSEGQKRLSWKPFETLFNVKAKNLTTSLNDIKKTGQEPIGIEKVEAIFKD